MATMKVKLENTKVNMRRASAANGSGAGSQTSGSQETEAQETDTQDATGQDTDGQNNVTVIALKSFQYGRRNYLALRRYEMEAQLAQKLASEGKVKITSA